jgi:Transcription factor Pcc1
LQATIILEYDSQKKADAVADAVSPDNYKAPEGLTIKTSTEKKKVVTEISFEGKMATFIATIDDLLESASTAEKTLSAIKEEML